MEVAVNACHRSRHFSLFFCVFCHLESPQSDGVVVAIDLQLQLCGSTSTRKSKMVPSNQSQGRQTPPEMDHMLMTMVQHQDWKAAEAFLETECSRDMVRYQDEFGNTILQIALGYKAPDEFLLKLIDTHPEATQIAGVDGWFPLHVAAMWGCSSAVMDAVVRHYPEALDITSDNGRTPRQFSNRFAHNKEALERTTAEWLSIIRMKRRRP